MKFWDAHGLVTLLVWLLLVAGAIYWAGNEVGLW